MHRRTKVKLVKIERASLQVAKKLFGVVVGAVLLAIAYNALIMPYGLLSAGISGLALFGQYLLHVPLYVGITVLNLPVFIWGLKELDREFIIYSLIGTLAMIVALPLSKPFIPVPHVDLFLASIFSGVISGLGVGIVFKFGASTGGTDIIAMIMKRKKNIAIGTFSFYVNIIVLVLSLFFFDLKIALYTIISIWVSGKVMNSVIDGLNRNKSVMIISEKGSTIAEHIMNDLKRGVTYLEGQGGFSGRYKLVVNCVVSNYELAKLKEIVLIIDPKAFMFVNDTIEVSGKGFSSAMKKQKNLVKR